MAGPNILCADVNAFLGGFVPAVVFELRGGRFAKQVGNSDILMRQNPGDTTLYRRHMANAMAWFKGRLFWGGGDRGDNTNFGSARVKRLNESTDTWEEVFLLNIGSTSGTLHYCTAIFVVTTGTEEYLVACSERSAFGVTHAPQWHVSQTGEPGSWTTYITPNLGGQLTTQGIGISHAGLLFQQRQGDASGFVLTSIDPVTGSNAQYTMTGTTRPQGGAFFKFDNRLFLIVPLAGETTAWFAEFAFGSWVRMQTGAGHLGAEVRFGNASTVQESRITSAVQIDDDTVLLFGSGDVGGGQGLRVYEVTLSAGSGSQLTVADVTATYVPPSLLPGGGLGDPDSYALFNVGKGDDGFWYLAFSSVSTNSAYSLMKVVPGGLLQDAGVMQAQTSYTLVTASMDGGERRDSRGSLPLIKAFPLGTAEGATGMIQTFRCDGDPLIAEHGAVGGTPPFNEGEAVTWTGGSGVILGGGVGAAAIRRQTLVGADPDGLLMTGAGGATATCSTSTGNGQAHTARMLYFKDANATGLGAPRETAPSGFCTMVAGSGVNCTVSKGTGPSGSDEVVTDADGSGQIKSFEWDFLLDSIGAFNTHNVKLRASRV